MRTARYRAVPPKIDRWRPIEEEIDRRRSIEREIDRRWSIKKEKGKKKRKRKKKKEEKKEYLARAPSSPTCRRRPQVACAPSLPAGRLCAVTARGRGRFFSCSRRRSVSLRGEKDRGD
ncbi:hypothetical protein BHE74_00031764, partial [Ensete ventricosum]